MSTHKLIPVVLALGLCAASCTKDGNPNNLPSVSTSSYEGKIDGYASSSEIYPENLVAYWSFDDTKNETLSGTAPTSTSNDAFVTGGVKGKALSLTAGYLYFGTQFNRFKTDSLKSFTISSWVKIPANNGSKRTMLFQLARKNNTTSIVGDINFILNTNAAASNTGLTIQPTFFTVGGGTQDNLNNAVFPAIGDRWVHVALTYNGTTGVFDIWGDGQKIGGYPNRGVGNNLFKAEEPNEVIFGANYNLIPGKTVSTDASFAAMTGQIDEVRIYNRSLPDAHVKALYNLGKAGK